MKLLTLKKNNKEELKIYDKQARSNKAGGQISPLEDSFLCSPSQIIPWRLPQVTPKLSDLIY